MIAFFVRSIGMLSPLLSSFYIFFKSIHYKAVRTRNIFAVIWCFLWASLFGYASVSLIISLPIIRPLACLTSVVFVFLIIRHDLAKQKELTYGQVFELTAAAYLFAFGISYFLCYIALFLVAFPSMFLLSSEIVVDGPLNYNEPIYLLLYSLTLIIHLFLSVFLFKIKRFKNGFPFIFKKYTLVVALFFTGIILMFLTWINIISQAEIFNYIAFLFITGILIIGFGIFLLIRRLVKNYQKMMIRQNSDNYLEKLYLEALDEIARLRKQNEEIEEAKSSVLHNISNKIAALQEAIIKGNATPEDADNLENAWQEELDKMKEIKPLPSTKINGLDILFDYYRNQFVKDDIDFVLILKADIKYMIDNVINQSHFETLITNHLNDARIAVNAGNNTYRRIMAIITIKDGCYEFTVFDSGISFEVDTLTRLGTERVTTHADTGGSGIGFVSTFEIMRKYNASLIISEQKESNINFSKSVSIRFDGKNRYIIETHRSEDFPVSERYTVIDCCI